MSGRDGPKYLLLTRAIEWMSSSFDSISQAIKSTFDFENFSKVTLTENTQLHKILLKSKKKIYTDTISVADHTLYFEHHILS